MTNEELHELADYLGEQADELKESDGDAWGLVAASLTGKAHQLRLKSLDEFKK